MKVSDFIFRFRTGIPGSPWGICRVRVFVNKSGELYSVLSQLDENRTISVTNAIESIYAQLVEQEKIPAAAALIEHYQRGFFCRAGV